MPSWPKRLRAEAARKGSPPGVRDLPTAIFRIMAAGREHEVRCAGLGEVLTRHFPEVKELARRPAPSSKGLSGSLR